MLSNNFRGEKATDNHVNEADAVLVEKCKKGNESAFEVLYKRYNARVYAIAFGVVRNREEAMEIVQETFTRVFRHIRSFKGDSSFYTWLYRITMNLSLDTARKLAKGKVLELSEIKGKISDSDDLFATQTPGDNLKKKELMEKLNKAIAQLPFHHRQVIIMREIGGMSYEEIACATKVAKGTVMSRLFHARRKIREKLERYLRETE